ncbi:MAG: hypothetical protein ABJG42_16610, partial [Vibrio splendidus]
FSASAARATLYLTVSYAKVVRGSRLGEYAHDPDMVEQVTQSVRTAFENEIDATGSLELTVVPGLVGKLTGLVRLKNRRSKKTETDHIVQTATRISRILPRPKLKWDIVEPVAPNLLKGRYVGTSDKKEVGPLCLLTMEESSCVVEVSVAIKRQDVIIGDLVVSGAPRESRNKQAIIDQLARRSIERNQLKSNGPILNIDPNSILVCSSKLGVEIEDA